MVSSKTSPGFCVVFHHGLERIGGYTFEEVIFLYFWKFFLVLFLRNLVLNTRLAFTTAADTEGAWFAWGETDISFLKYWIASMWRFTSSRLGPGLA